METQDPVGKTERERHVVLDEDERQRPRESCEELTQSGALDGREPGRRLVFDVTRQPPPLREWSPYANVVPPHLDGYFLARRGEFRLVRLTGNRTRLEGSTWYELRIEPVVYWSVFADLIVGRIHRRVLEHIRNEVR